MNWLTKAINTMRHPRPVFVSGLLKRTRFDYRREVGDCLDASVVTAPVQWLQRSLPEARLSVRRRQRNGKVTPLADHEMLALIQKPNPYYGDIALWFGTVLSYCIDGNAYWAKVRNRAGRPIELWYIPHWLIEPRPPEGGNRGEFLDHYRYTPGGGHAPMLLEPDDVVHFRHGINPHNLLKGLSPLDGVIREVFADLESSNFVSSLLRNMGVPGVVISPKSGAMPTPDDVDATKAWFKQAFGGDNRGGPLVMGGPTEVQPYGFNPQQMNMSEARDVAEERVCACLGVPAAVVGFGAGLQQTQVGATMEELRKLAWHNGVLPMGRGLADELGRSLLPDFGGANASDRLEAYWETGDVLALQEDETRAVERKLKELEKGAITLFDYLSETGREADDSHRYYLRPISVLEVPESEAGRPSPEPLAEPDPTAARAKGRGAKGAGHDHDAPADARRASAAQIKRGMAFVRLLQRQERGLRAAFEKPLKTMFQRWGAQTEAAAREAGGTEGKSADGDLTTRILKLLDIPAWRAELTQAYGAHYLEVAKAVQGAAESAGLGTLLPDTVARAIVAEGGKRVGLVDLDRQTREAVFDALAEGRAEGASIEKLANMIAEHVEGGPWSDGITRARIIARTETAYARNVSTVETAKFAGVGQFMVFDGLLGPGRSLDSHIARNGTIVSAEEAAIMAEEEHPNGTLSFAPHIDLEN